MLDSEDLKINSIISISLFTINELDESFLPSSAPLPSLMDVR